MAKELSNTQKKEWAKTLYLKENLTQQEIADRVGGVPRYRQSLDSRWKMGGTEGRTHAHP